MFKALWLLPVVALAGCASVPADGGPPELRVVSPPDAACNWRAEAGGAWRCRAEIAMGPTTNERSRGCTLAFAGPALRMMELRFALPRSVPGGPWHLSGSSVNLRDPAFQAVHAEFTSATPLDPGLAYPCLVSLRLRPGA